jgi:hypothetical protein
MSVIGKLVFYQRSPSMKKFDILIVMVRHLADIFSNFPFLFIFIVAPKYEMK